MDCAYSGHGSDDHWLHSDIEPGSKSCTVAATSTSCSVPGLSSSTSYTFSVVASSAGGVGPAGSKLRFLDAFIDGNNDNIECLALGTSECWHRNRSECTGHVRCNRDRCVQGWFDRDHRLRHRRREFGLRSLQYGRAGIWL